MSDDDFTNLIETLTEEIGEGRARLNAEWTSLVALRDLIGIANKGSTNNSATYERAFALGRVLLEPLFDPEKSLLYERKLSETARRYIQEAAATSKVTHQTVSPIELIKNAITKYEKLIKEEDWNQDTSLLKKELSKLYEALQELEKRKSSENSFIFRDAYQVERELPISGKGRNYVTYKISDERALRVRVLHPDKAEHSTGVDLIYENYWEKGNEKLVRLCALQYKLWQKKSLYIDDRIEEQLRKMQGTFCDKGICGDGSQSMRRDRYRLPFCAVFLRPTDELQSENSSLLSTGCYVPICVVRRVQQTTTKGNSILRSKSIRSEAVTHKIFEEMFNSNMLGSRWLRHGELENLYHAHSILESDEHIIIHAQEFTI